MHRYTIVALLVLAVLISACESATLDVGIESTATASATAEVATRTVTPAPSATVTQPAPSPTTESSATATVSESSPVSQPSATPTPHQSATATATARLDATPTPPPTPSAPTSPTGTTAIPPAEREITVDNRDSAVTRNGTWFTGDGGSNFGSDCAWAPRGIGNTILVRPGFPRAGAYEVFAWWCGDPNHDQSTRAEYQMHPTTGFVAYQPVFVNLQEDAGQWNSLGTFWFETNGSVGVVGNLQGNVVFDAQRVVYRGASRDLAVTPTPRPTPTTIVTNNPPSPLQQRTQGDLTARLRLVNDPFYEATSLVTTEEVTVDDCEAFPREGCAGSVTARRAQVRYQEVLVTYLVSPNYQYLAIDAPTELRSRQRVYLEGFMRNDAGQRERYIAVDRYMDGTWHEFVDGGQSGGKSQGPARESTLAVLQDLIDTYSSITVETDDGWELHLYGLGPRVALSEADRSRLVDLGMEINAALP